MIKKEVNKITQIKKISYSDKKTNTCLFLLPAIEIGNNVNLDSVGFVNAYLGDEEYEHHYKNSIYVLFKPTDRGNFEEFLELMYSRNIIKDEYDLDEEHVMVVFKFPEEYMKEYRFFKQGKYSKFSKTYIKKFFQFTKKVTVKGEVKNEFTLFYHIFNKTDWIKNWWTERLGYNDPKQTEELNMDEWWDIPEPEKEIFRHPPKDKSKIK